MKLIALDLDGTLFNNKSQISRENIKAIKEATAAGINVVISTGRPFGGLPFEAIKGTGIRYAITANGSAIYEIDTKKCLYENCLSDETAFSIIDYLMTKRVQHRRRASPAWRSGPPRRRPEWGRAWTCRSACRSARG